MGDAHCLSLARWGHYPHPLPLPTTGEGVRGLTTESTEDTEGSGGTNPNFVAWCCMVLHLRYGSCLFFCASLAAGERFLGVAYNLTFPYMLCHFVVPATTFSRVT